MIPMDEAMAVAGVPPLANDIATVNQIKSEMKQELIERDTEVDLLVLSGIARVHGLLIGAPGIAKSMTADGFCQRITGIEYFKKLLRKSLPVEEIVGPVSLQGLTQDQYRYITTGKLPEAHIAFLDEIWKANAVVLNSMLQILNEREFSPNGGIVKVPLWFGIGASNELPTEQELMAIRDRFGWCRIVESVKTDDGFKAILQGQVARNAGTGVAASPTTISKDSIERLQAAARAVTVGNDVLTDLAQMRRKAEGEKNLIVSPRRYGEGIKLCQAHALLCGRTHVQSDDMTLFQHVMWTDEEDIPTAFELTLDFAGKVAKEAAKLRQAFDPLRTDLLAMKNEMAANAGQMTQDSIAKLAPLAMNLTKVRDQVNAQIADAKQAARDHGELDSLLRDVIEAKRIISEEIMG